MILQNLIRNWQWNSDEILLVFCCIQDFAGEYIGIF